MGGVDWKHINIFGDHEMLVFIYGNKWAFWNAWIVIVVYVDYMLWMFARFHFGYTIAEGGGYQFLLIIDANIERKWIMIKFFHNHQTNIIA